MTTDEALVAELRAWLDDCVLAADCRLVGRAADAIERLSAERQAIEDRALERAAAAVDLLSEPTRVGLPGCAAYRDSSTGEWWGSPGGRIRSLKGTPPATSKECLQVGAVTLSPDVLADTLWPAILKANGSQPDAVRTVMLTKATLVKAIRLAQETHHG